MEQLTELLLKSLQTGFIDQSITSTAAYCPKLLTNNEEAGEKILSTIDWELKNCDEFWISVAFVTTSGVATIMNTLLELREKGVQGKILVSQYLNFSQPEALKRLLLFENIELKIAVDGNFHSKGYLFKNDKLYDLIIGSSNLTANALCLNKEWNLKVSASPESHIICSSLGIFQNEFDKAQIVNEKFVSEYEIIYNTQRQLLSLKNEALEIGLGKKAIPNGMQREALVNLEKLRNEGRSKALLISATGTGKTFLSAFDAYKFNPEKFLFVVHRANIAEAAMKTFQAVFGSTKSMGFYSGNRREKNKDFVFSTIQTISKDEHLNEFSSNHFDYIVIDESHHAGAESYKKIMGHFTPKFLLGMTATPERMDEFDIFSMFDHNVAYEIRLHKAMKEEMLSPFHYFGIADMSVNGEEIDDKRAFKKLTSDERVERIIEKAKLYGCDNGTVRGLIFCSKKDECITLSDSFNRRGYRTIALTDESSEKERAKAIDNLESTSIEDKIDYIFTVDIFNEGVDIPKVNQIILLRPTKSAIVFVQQLGRGLRKTTEKDYLTVIDFIGNYSNNYLVPIALYGDTSYNKDTLRKLMASGSSLIPGASTINFDKISMANIFKSIDTANLQLKKDLIKDYQLLRFRLGRMPMMMDFISQGARDPFQYVLYSKSYFNFVSSQEKLLQPTVSKEDQKLLELFSLEINNGKRIEESLILKLLAEKGDTNISEIKKIILNDFGYHTTDETIKSSIRNINFEFITENHNKKLISISDIYNIKTVQMIGSEITFSKSFTRVLKNSTFSKFFNDSIEYSINEFTQSFNRSRFKGGFLYYRKYSRKDVFRILNWEQNPVAQNVGGYVVSSDKTNCPIFVNYHKAESISNSTKYEDKYLDKSQFEWMSKSKRTLNSPDVRTIRNYKSGLRIPLFIKKSNDEGLEFYYMGDVTPQENSFVQETLNDDKGGKVSVVKMIFSMDYPVEDSIYHYLTTGDDVDNDLIPRSIELPKISERYLKILPFNEVKPYINSVPLLDITVAAGDFSELPQTSDIEWVELPHPFEAREDYFVCKVVGESMNKKIPNGSWCLFKKDPGGTRDGKIVLVQHYDIQDQDFGAGFTVKEYHSKKRFAEEIWSHEEIILKPLSYSPNYSDIILSNDELQLNVLGIFVSVL